MNLTIQSPIKWTGSKRYLAPQLAKLFPKNYRNIIDPFIGGGNMLPYYRSAKVIACDIIPELIELYKTMRADPEKTIQVYTELYNCKLNYGLDVYYEIRDSFNRNRSPLDLLFLTRNSVNGLIRFNSSGDFNASAHIGRNGIKPENFRKILYDFLPYLKKVDFRCQDYSHSLLAADSKDFIFLDPPYKGSNGKMYSTDFDHDRLMYELVGLTNRNIKWMMTYDANAEIPNTIKLILDSGTSPFNKYKNIKSEVKEAVFINYSLI